VYTVGHSTRSLDELVDMLRAHGVRAIADVRRYPQSRKHPHFNDDAIAKSLPEQGIQYFPFPALGGRRRARKDSPNTGWRSESFRGYADYMQTPEFQSAIDDLLRVAAEQPTATMCAEAVPWRCHRSLISDALLARGCAVLDIMSAATSTPHHLTPFARVDGGKILYPKPAHEVGLFD
jgi:uncharacterized protein (DUF488 family)